MIRNAEELPAPPPLFETARSCGATRAPSRCDTYRVRTKVFADGCVPRFPVPELKSRGRAADMLQTVLTHGCVVLYLRWLPGGGACSLQHECLCMCMWSGLRLGTLLPPYCSGGCVSVPAAAAVVALLVYVCVRAQECPDHGLFTKQPFACFSPPHPWHANTVVVGKGEMVF